MISWQQPQPPALTETISGVSKDPRRISPLVCALVCKVQSEVRQHTGFPGQMEAARLSLVC